MTKSEWKKISGGLWEHVTGWRVYHCGHHTANFPYYALPPGVDPRRCSQDQMLLHGGFGLGYAFRLLKDCQDAVEREAAKGNFGEMVRPASA